MKLSAVSFPPTPYGCVSAAASFAALAALCTVQQPFEKHAHGVELVEFLLSTLHGAPLTNSWTQPPLAHRIRIDVHTVGVLSTIVLY